MHHAGARARIGLKFDGGILNAARRVHSELRTATIHRARTNDDSRTLCGWNYRGATFRARRTDTSGVYRELNGIATIPGHMMCDRCLPTERAVALNKDIIHDEVSADEK